ncbi:metallophosphoesterase [Pseudomonadota bacterium]
MTQHLPLPVPTEEKKVKLLHLSDIHFNQAVMKWALDMSANVDVMCITGDFLNDSSSAVTPVDMQVDETLRWLSQLRCDTLLCSGNHDDAEYVSSEWLRSSGVTLCDSQHATIKGITFGSVPYGAEAFEKYAACDVLLHHEPPAKLKVAREKGRDYGSTPLLSALQAGTISPKWLLCGHVHYPARNISRFRNTLISNPGTNDRKDNQPSYHMITL